MTDARSINYADFDPVIVERVISGHRVGSALPAPESAEVVRRLAAQGYSDGQIAHRLGFTRRAVARIRQRRGIAPGVMRGHCPTVNAPSRPKRQG